MDFRSALHPPSSTPASGDRRDGRVYLPLGDTLLRVNVALATGRPLLVQGEPGVGKSSLAVWIARTLGWRYLEHVVTSRCEARDLLWRYDAIARLSDANTPGAVAGAPAAYVDPGPLWWAMAPTVAASFGGRVRTPPAPVGWAPTDPRAVLLVDEIDKADPELPNDLLVAIGSRRFKVAETGDTVDAALVPFLVFTTNAERDLPAAFLRRCVTLTLPSPRREDFVEIGRLHEPEAEPALLDALAERIVSLRTDAERMRRRRPSIAEYLDAVRACRELGVTSGSDVWETLTAATLVKEPAGTESVARA